MAIESLNYPFTGEKGKRGDKGPIGPVGLPGDVSGDVADYLINAITGVEADTITSVIGVSSVSRVVRPLPFKGWAEKYTPAGVSFNAVKLGNLADPATLVTSTSLAYVKVVVRTGVDSHLAGSTVVALGESVVRPGSTELTSLTVLLRHPETGTVITLDDSYFVGNEYIIGVYGMDDFGDDIAVNEIRAVTSNTATQSYYATSTDAVTGLWTSYSANLRVGVEHLMLVNPVETKIYTPSDALSNALIAKAGESVQETSLLHWAPPTVYGLEGTEVSIYFDNLINGNYTDYNYTLNGYNKGTLQAERLRLDLAAADIANASDVEIEIYENTQEIVSATATFDIETAAIGAGTGITETCIFIGDSITQAGVITQTVLDNAAADVLSVTLLGTRGTAPNLHEGRGGYSLNDYCTAGRTFYIFTVSGVTDEPSIASTIYSNNGSTYRVEEKNLSGGSGTITCLDLYGVAPEASGTLTKTSGSNGDETITYSSVVQDSGNPFWDTAINFPGWLTDNSFVVPDWVFISLGTNDVFSKTSDAQVVAETVTRFALLDNLITSIHAAGAGVKVALVPPPPPTGSQDGFGASYGSSYERWRVKRNYVVWNTELVAKYRDSEVSRIYICPAGLNWDTQNNVHVSASEAVNSRSSVMVQRHTNGVHPPNEGYQQIGDAIFAFLKCQQ